MAKKKFFVGDRLEQIGSLCELFPYPDYEGAPFGQNYAPSMKAQVKSLGIDSVEKLATHLAKGFGWDEEWRFILLLGLEMGPDWLAREVFGVTRAKKGVVLPFERKAGLRHNKQGAVSRTSDHSPLDAA